MSRTRRSSAVPTATPSSWSPQGGAHRLPVVQEPRRQPVGPGPSEGGPFRCRCPHRGGRGAGTTRKVMTKIWPNYDEYTKRTTRDPGRGAGASVKRLRSRTTARARSRVCAAARPPEAAYATRGGHFGRRSTPSSTSSAIRVRCWKASWVRWSGSTARPSSKACRIPIDRTTRRSTSTCEMVRDSDTFLSSTNAVDSEAAKLENRCSDERRAASPHRALVQPSFVPKRAVVDQSLDRAHRRRCSPASRRVVAPTSTSSSSPIPLLTICGSFG